MPSNNPVNPFFPFSSGDFSQFDVSKMLSDLKVPGVDVQGLLATQRKNIEALTAANQVAVEGMQAVAKRQAEIMAQALAEVSTAAQELSKSGDPQQLSERQAELVKAAFEKALANMKELAEMVNKANADAFAVINTRVNESIEELKAAVGQK